MPVALPTPFNPADKGPTCALAADERTITVAGSGSSMTRSYTKVSSGKWYVEFTRVSATTWMFGISSATGNLSNYCGATAESIGLYGGTIYQGGSGVGSWASGATTGVFGIAIDADAKTIQFLNAGGISAAITYTLTGDVYLAGGPDGSPAGSLSLNAGQDAFTYSVPSGFTPGFALLDRYVFEGVVRDENGDPAARTVRAHIRSTGALVGEVVSDPVTGAYRLAPVPNNAVKHIVYALDDDDLGLRVWDHRVPV